MNDLLTGMALAVFGLCGVAIIMLIILIMKD